jgi:hypothetical protein
MVAEVFGGCDFLRESKKLAVIKGGGGTMPIDGVSSTVR